MSVLRHEVFDVLAFCVGKTIASVDVPTSGSLPHCPVISAIRFTDGTFIELSATYGDSDVHATVGAA